MVGDGDSESLAGCWWYHEGDSDGDSSTQRPEAVLVMVFALAMGMLTALESHSCRPSPGPAFQQGTGAAASTTDPNGGLGC